ncbi:MAG: ArnT family glycosyltransferase [Bryobacteraceae bacterium]
MNLSRWIGRPDSRHFALLALASAVLLLGAIRLGDLAGYDDALFAAEAKNIVRSGRWLPLMMRGAPAGEHPPLFVWMQALSFHAFGISDIAAKLPSALCGLGVVLLVWRLARRLLDDSVAAAAAMFVMLATPYFLKYSNRAMTDVPTTFFFVCAVCAWVAARRHPRWYLGAGLFTGLALVTRGLVGFALPLAFGMEHILVRRQGPKAASWVSERAYLLAGLVLAIAPLTSWYAYFLTSVPGFLAEQRRWLEEQVYGGLAPAWRRYTGAPEYLWMLAKSYWPWLPAMVAGAAVVIRQRRRELYVLLCWVGAVFLLCAVTRSRVLRYMLPAYPAFAILAAIGVANWVSRRTL